MLPNQIEDADQLDPSGDDEFLAVARKRFKQADEAEIQTRIDRLDDKKFRAGEQWPLQIRQARELDGRPCLTINRVAGSVHQVTNDQRQNRPSIKVNPVDDKATVETAKVIQGMIRHIENNSNADIAYDTAFDGTATDGLGYYRIITAYCDPMSFNQEILIKRIRNSFTVYLDPNSQEPDGSDSNWGFVFDDMPIEDYRAQFGDSDLAKSNDWRSLSSNTEGQWITDSTIRVAEYFYKTFEKTDICLLSDGSVCKKKDCEKVIAAAAEGGVQLTVLKERQTVLPAIKWAKINGAEVLEKKDWAGQWIPIIPVPGDEIDIDGKKILAGLVRNAKDPSRMYNYWNTAATETIALAPRAPFIGYAGQFEGHENKWKTANTVSHAYLEANPTMVNGAPAPLPTRNIYEPPTQAITQAMHQAADDIKATTGIYDASLGNRSNENSGRAIERRNTQAQTGNFHFVDNLSRSIRHGGRIIIDLIPHVYDVPGAQRILHEDGQAEMVVINQIFQEQGQDKIHRLDYGKYDCTVTTGPNFTTKRQEAASTMLEFTKSVPQAAPLIMDLIARNMDWPGADVIADRLKKGLPLGVAEDDKENQMPIPPQVKQQMDQQSQMIQQLTEHLHAAQDEVDQKTRELESKERIEMKKVQANIEIALAQIGSKESQTLLMHEVGAINKRLELLQMNQPIEEENEPAPETAPQVNQPTGGQSPGQPME